MTSEKIQILDFHKVVNDEGNSEYDYIIYFVKIDDNYHVGEIRELDEYYRDLSVIKKPLNETFLCYFFSTFTSSDKYLAEDKFMEIFERF